jgi:Tol biopolymer transport system component
MRRDFYRVPLSCCLMLGLIFAFGGRPAPAWAEAAQNQAEARVTQVPGAIVLNHGDWVYYLTPETKQSRKLVKGRYPALSPDGHKVTYGLVQGNGGGCRSLMVLDLAGGRIAALVPPLQEMVGGPAWSPSGDLVAFMYQQRDLFIVRADGSGRQKIFVVPGGVYQPPVWAPDGKSLFVADMENLIQVDLTGKQLAATPLAAFTGRKEAVSSSDRFAPNHRDPELWVFTMGVAGTPKFEKTFNEPVNALFLYERRTGKRTRLSPADMLAMSPCWSRDGNVIYFSGYREPHYQERDPFRIYRINRDGSGLTELGKGEDPSQ